jgi:hypothetical protein
MYQIISDTHIMRLSDGATFQHTPGNRDYEKYLKWEAEGNTPEPAPEPTLEARRAAVWERIKARREALKSSGVLVGAHWFHSDADSRIQQIGLVMMGAGLPAGLKWKVKDNGLVDMTPALAQQIFQATAAWDMLVFGVAETHRAAVIESDNPEVYDWLAGWPEGYGGAE